MTGKNGNSFAEWSENLRWFREHYRQLARKYDRRNVCVYKGEVVDYDSDLRRLVRRIRGKYPSDRVLVEYVSRKKLEMTFINTNMHISATPSLVI